ncbi:hypothetical protein Pcar_0116 [Syntrophotalea carbinolica DSM 2380]|uniref:Uncharacterized protein n=1 Tax=Syntrophotalea carbinolica (strain DSM 2380 / NBRC 103641 / GraBd1) TaxID=338963 RepID=Q3A8B3_SYNC1|nr:hypothetical protein [Syntrophotalea carbinolica]ABA87379.1 hypothetical protein Pcar_0116 [Syntrophotalea carbinolica DSM 2380]
MSIQKVVIKEFPKDGRPWRVDWFGEVHLNPNISDEPQIELLISPFIGKPSDAGSTRAVNHHQQRIIRVGVGQLPLIHIGSIWENGKKLPRHLFTYTSNTFSNLVVSPNSLRLIKTSHQDDGEFLLPFKFHPFGKGVSGINGRCVTISHKNDPFHVIVPCTEIIRFYFSQTTKLARALLNGEISSSTESLYDSEKSSLHKDGTCVLHIGMRFDDEDAWVAARLAFSEIANKIARGIHGSIIKNSLNNESGAPEAYPPFYGETNLQTYGKWIQSGDKWRFLVFWINSCSAPFPYNELCCIRKNCGLKPLWDDNDRKSSGWSGRPLLTGKGPDEYSLGDDTPPDRKEPRVNLYLPENRFTHLIGKALIKPEKLRSEYKAGGQKPCFAEKQNDECSTGGLQIADSNTGGLEIKPGPISLDSSHSSEWLNLSATFPNFLHGLKALEHRGAFQVKVIPGSNKTIQSNSGPISFFPIRNQKGYLKWSYIHLKNREYRERRKAIVGRIDYAGYIFYLMESQQRESEHYTMFMVYRYDFGDLKTGIFEAILACCAQNKGKWLKDDEFPEYGREKVKHMWRSYEEFAAKINDIINRIIGGQ